jgi:hypothetical protein
MTQIYEASVTDTDIDELVAVGCAQEAADAVRNAFLSRLMEERPTGEFRIEVHLGDGMFGWIDRRTQSDVIGRLEV